MKLTILFIVFCGVSFAQSCPTNYSAPQACAGAGIWSSLVAIPGANLLSNTNFGNTAVQVCHAQYSFAVDGGGAPGLITPANNCTIPARSTIYGASLNWTTAGVGATNTTSIGVTGTGGGAAALAVATVVGSLTGNEQAIPVQGTSSTWVRITTSGTVTLTTAVAALTAGICEIYVFYFTSST